MTWLFVLLVTCATLVVLIGMSNGHKFTSLELLFVVLTGPLWLIYMLFRRQD
ncbi:hypothetical protein [Mycolicibacterium fortuitum]|uniref:hypothetical protein n=1 Tax=Mycolicibacterium fortuitum TaxID=1766 RepID=UPI000AAC988B|nr:hypothetical protein [Mycolicibacterium fortuitum]